MEFKYFLAGAPLVGAAIGANSEFQTAALVLIPALMSLLLACAVFSKPSEV